MCFTSFFFFYFQLVLSKASESLTFYILILQFFSQKTTVVFSFFFYSVTSHSSIYPIHFPVLIWNQGVIPAGDLMSPASQLLFAAAPWGAQALTGQTAYTVRSLQRLLGPA